MYPGSVRAIQADALFVSALQCGDELNTSEIQRAVMVADSYGDGGCAERVAQEFGDHPETAAVRMRWARAAAAILEAQSVPGNTASVRGRPLRPGRDAGAETAGVRDGVI